MADQTRRVRSRAPRDGIGRQMLGLPLAAAVGAMLTIAAVSAFRTVPMRNTPDPQVDALLVLGTPTDLHGHATQAECWRVDEALREYHRGRAHHLLMTGGPTSNGHVEAQAMAAYARAQGLPAADVLEEDRAMTTVENIRNSAPILESHGWWRVEVISTAEHLPRAAVLLAREHTGLQWQMHAAPTPGRSRVQLAGAYAEEAIGTAVLRVFGLHAEPVLHGVATVQHGIFRGLRWCGAELKRFRPHLAQR